MTRLFHLLKSYSIRFREELSYLFFGVLTTLVNYGVFFVFHVLWPDRFVLLSNLLAFVSAAAFAYLTNKLYVFRSRDWSWRVVRREAAAFLAARVFSFGLEEAGLALAVYVLRLGRFSLWGVDGILISKFVLSALATVLNYFFSKYLIFTKQEERT